MGLYLPFEYLSPVLNSGIIFACLRAVGKEDLSIAPLKL